ncbi:MAG: asparaginyl-tRNA synthetase [Tremellales sp. Tagirdzhanova-0007]|nr:MAG: asparaginyl-tRNA synthetase [Tremellales sp. Tagirdzhanova-0007]
MRYTLPSLGTLPPTIRALLALPPSPQSEVTIRGWIKSVRQHKNVSFAAISDGSESDSLQAVFPIGTGAEHVTPGASVLLQGRFERSRGMGQEMELVVKRSVVLGACDVSKKALPEHVLRENAHLRFKTARMSAVMRIRDGLARDWHDWFEENEFVHVQTPILTASDCEGAGEVFTLSTAEHAIPSTTLPSSMPLPADTISNPTSRLPSPSVSSATSASSTSSPSSPSTFTSPAPSSIPDPPLSPSRTDPFFPHPVNLSVSSQLHLECPTHALARTYTLSPCFRAEPSSTSRHLSEFYMLEAEIGFLDSLDQLLDVVEQGIRETLQRLLTGKSRRHERMRRDLTGEEGNAEMHRAELVNVSTGSFHRVSYTHAIELLKAEHTSHPFIREPIWGHSLSSEHEKWLAQESGGPVFITRYPKSLKPFYMLPSQDGSTVECFDLLLPGIGELAGGSLREHRLSRLEQVISDAGLDTDQYEWYLDLRRYGSVPHGGWGMGWDRWICWLTGVGNVRDVVPFPRWKGHCKY